ncbi:MAG: Gldg family protein [Proteobacteria bacterium]|nr:Gldg family protein [Pseudomonadota bacterium]
MKKIALIAIFFTTFMCFLLSSRFIIFKEVTPYSLSQTTLSLLAKFHDPIEITLYSQNIDTHHAVHMLIERYQNVQKQIQFNWQKKYPDQNQLKHIVEIKYKNAKQIIDLDKHIFDENQFTQALFKLQRQKNQWVVFLTGHQECSAFGSLNSDMNLFRISLENQGLKVVQINLAQTPFIPDNTSVLVIASPKTALLPQEEMLILSYLAKGKDLLWLSDPSAFSISLLSKALGVTALPGTIVDWHGQKLGVHHPAITIIDKYPKMAFDTPNAITAFPMAQALKIAKTDFDIHPLLITHRETWTTKDTAHAYDEQAFPGPLLLGLTLTKDINPNKQQRVVVIGNSRFLSNGTIENYGNLALGLNLINWLNHDDVLLNISHPVVKDNLLQLHLWAALIIEYGFVSLSLLLFLCSIIYFLNRHRISNKITTMLSLR